MRKTQCEIVIDRLLMYGSLSRNWCINRKPRITRAAARIADLKKAGWKFETRRINEDKDFIYYMRKMPKGYKAKIRR